MIGASSFLLETLPVVFASLLLAYGGLRAWRREQGGIPLLVTALLFWGLLGVRYVYQWRSHLYLEGLSASLSSLRVGPTRIEDRTAIAQIVSTLRKAQWFSSNHGGWDVELDLELEDSAPVHVRVALYHREPGAVLSFSRGGGWADGYAFSQELPRVLASAGAPLPGRRWVQAFSSGEWRAWYDAATVTGQGAQRWAWTKLQKGHWTGATPLHIVDCASRRIRYEPGRYIPETWTREFTARAGSVSAGLVREVCSSGATDAPRSTAGAIR